MTPFRHIRVNVFKITQEEMSMALGLSQPTISRLENDKVSLTSDVMQRVRSYAAENGIKWSDKHFFEVPAAQART